MEIKFSENDIRELLNTVSIFDPTIGHYQFFTVNEQFLYIVKLTNGTIYFTIDDLMAQREQRLSKEQLMQIASRFTRTAAPSGGPQRRRDSAIPDEYAAALGTSEPKRNRSKMIFLACGIVMVLGMVGAMVVLMDAPEPDLPIYTKEPADSVDTNRQIERENEQYKDSL